MVKDRMGELKARRPSIFRSIKESIRRKDVQRNNTTENFLQDVTAIEGAMQKLKDGVAETQRLQANVLCTPSAGKKLHNNLAKSNSQNRELSANVRKLINKLRQNYNSPSDNDATATQPKVNETIVQQMLGHLTSEFAKTVNEWQGAEAIYHDKVKERLRREYSIIGESKTDKELNDLLSEDQPHAVFTQDIIKEIQEAQMMLDQLQERERELLKLERGVVEVHELFTDFQNLVSEQGQKLDLVEDRVENARENVEAGNVKLKKAKVYKKRSRKRKLVIAGIVVVVVLLAAAIITVIVLTG